MSGKSYGKVSGDRTMDDIEKRRQDPWNFLFIAGMWFQDLFNYDFRRTEMCIIPYGRRKARFPSAPTTPASAGGKIIENMHKTATVAEWYKNTANTKSTPRAKTSIFRASNTPAH